MPDTPTNGTTANGHDASGGPGVIRIPIVAPSISERERELALNSLERRLSRHDDLVENFYAFSRQWIGQQTDPRRNLFIECGYPLEPTIDMYRNLYEREPLATRAVEVYPKECWQQTPTVYEDMDVDKVTDFEEAWDQLGSTLRTESSWYQDEEGSPIWDELQRADILSRIGSYGVILLGIDDGKNLQEPLDGVMVTNAKALADSPMTNDEEHRLLHPHGRWQATDVDGLESKSYIHSGPDRVGEATLSRNQVEQVEQWRWERHYQEQGMAPQLAVNTAKNRMARKRKNVEIEHVNPCPSCKKQWPIDADPKDDDGRCPNCGRQVPLASLTDNAKHLYREVSAKSPQDAAKIVQNQVYMERGWWPRIIGVKPLQRSTSAGIARNELEPEWTTNANPEGHNQYTGKNAGKNPHVKKLIAQTVGDEPLAGGTYVRHPESTDSHVKFVGPFANKADAHVVSTLLNPQLPIGTGKGHEDMSANEIKYVTREPEELGYKSVLVIPKSKVVIFGDAFSHGIDDITIAAIKEDVEKKHGPTTNASDGYGSREAPRTRGHRNPNNDERAPTDRGKTLDPRKQAQFDPTDGHAQRQGDFAEVYGTDQQYDDQGYGIGMPPPAAELGYSLSGTDEQYFGVQFGPSEQPAPPTDPATAWPVGVSITDQDGNQQNPKRRRPRLLFMRPYSEDLVQVVRYEWNIRNPRFGYPVMYRITLNDPRETQGGVGLPLATVFVHWSRVIHLCDRTKCGGVSSNPTFTIPALKPVFNSILDAQKVTGAGAEGYYKSCFTGLQFSTHPQMGGDVMVDEASIKAQLQDYQNGLTRGLLSIGGQWSTLAPSVVDPTPHYNLAVEKICIVLACPVRIFKGSERGELASSQDDESWNKRRLERQVNYLTPRVIVPLIDRLIQVGVLPVPGQKSGKQQVQNILTRQPQAKALRVNGGWLVTNVRKRVRMLNANPEGHNQYTEGMSVSEVAKLHGFGRKLSGWTPPAKKDNPLQMLKGHEAKQSNRHAVGKYQAGLHSESGDQIHETNVSLAKSLPHNRQEWTHISASGERTNGKGAESLHKHLSSLTSNTVSPSVGDHASHVAQAQAMDKGNQQRPGKAKDQQAFTGQAGGPDAWSKPLTDEDGEPLHDAPGSWLGEFHRELVDNNDEDCPHCGAKLERGDDGKCNRCGEDWSVENVNPEGHSQYTGKIHKLSPHEEVALSRHHLGGVEALRTPQHHVDSKTMESLMKKGIFDKRDITDKGKAHVKVLQDKYPNGLPMVPEHVTDNSSSQEAHWDGTPTINAKKPKQPDEQHPRNDYTSQPDSIGSADPAAMQPGNFPHDSPKLNPGYDPPETGFSHATGAPLVGPAESKSRFEGTSRYGTDADTTGNPATDTGGGWEPPVTEGDGGAQPWETGQTGVMPVKSAAIFVSDGGYSVEWPDPEAVGKKDKAAIALQYTQALSAYVQGGCEATMPFKLYLVHIWDWEEELAQEMIDAAKKLHDADSEDQPLTQPKMIAGQPAEAADGTQAAKDSKDKADQAKAQADALAKSKAGGIGAGKSGMMNPPNKGDAKLAATAKASQPKPPGDEA